MVFISTHLSLRPSLSSTEGLNPFKPLAESSWVHSVAVHPSIFRHQFENLGVYLDSRLSFDKQVSETCKASYFHIRALRHIRSSLTTDAVETVALDHGLIIAMLSSLAHLQFTIGPASRIPLHALWPKSLALIIITPVLSSYVLSESDFPFDTE